MAEPALVTVETSWHVPLLILQVVWVFESLSLTQVGPEDHNPLVDGGNVYY